MSQVRLSIELEVAQETVSAYENQKHYPSFLQLVKLSNLFHASIDYIMGLSDVRIPTNCITSSQFFDFGVQGPVQISNIVEDLKHLNNEQLELVSLVIKEFIKK